MVAGVGEDFLDLLVDAGQVGVDNVAVDVDDGRDVVVRDRAELLAGEGWRLRCRGSVPAGRTMGRMLEPRCIRRPPAPARSSAELLPD